jgi:hypothetical protein
MVYLSPEKRQAGNKKAIHKSEGLFCENADG